MEKTPEIIVIKRGWLFFRPVLWLMCPYFDKENVSFKVGEFRDWNEAEKAKQLLTDELKIREENKKRT